jgi:hypothetical protein
MQESVPAVGQDATAPRLYGRLLGLPVSSEFAEPAVTFVVRPGRIASGKPGTVAFGTLTVDAWLMRFASAV